MNRLYDWFMPSLRLSRPASPAADVAARIGNHTVDSLFLILPRALTAQGGRVIVNTRRLRQRSALKSPAI